MVKVKGRKDLRVYQKRMCRTAVITDDSQRSQRCSREYWAMEGHSEDGKDREDSWYFCLWQDIH